MSDLENLKRTYDAIGIPYSVIKGDDITDFYPELGGRTVVYIGENLEDDKVRCPFSFASLCAFDESGAFVELVLDYDYIDEDTTNQPNQ